MGEWIDLTVMDENDLQDAINKVLAQSNEEVAEEWEIADYERFYGLEIHRYSSVKTMVELAEAINQHGKIKAIRFLKSLLYMLLSL